MSTARVSWSDRMNTMRVSSGGSEADDCLTQVISSEEFANVGEEEMASIEGKRREDTTRSVEALDMHWLLKTANPNWTKKELDSALGKLKQVGIINFLMLEDTLQGKGILNNLLRDQGLKAFGSKTLDNLRNAVVSERERQRQAELLMLQRETRRLEQETRRSKASMGTTSAALDMDEAPTAEERRESAQSDDSETSAVAQDADVHLAAMTAESASPTTETDLAADSATEEDISRVQEDKQLPSQFLPASRFRRGLNRGLSVGHSWEWPLTRDEKKERISMLDRQVLKSYERELDDLKQKMARQVHRDEIDSFCDEGDEEPEEPEEPTLSSASSPKADSELGIIIAG